MKILGRHKILTAWLLTALLLLPVAVRTIHLWEQEHAATEEDAHARHDCASCAICHFSLSTFTGAEAVGCEFLSPYADFAPVLFYGEQPDTPTLFSYGLRAPPFV